MSQPPHNPENPPEPAQASSLPSYESALHLPPDTMSFTPACLQSIDRLLILLICFCILCLLFLNCSFVLYFFCLLTQSVCFMVGSTIVPLSFSRILPCCPCPILVTEIHCRTDGSDIQLLLASNNHLRVDLFSVPPLPQHGTTFIRV